MTGFEYALVIVLLGTAIAVPLAYLLDNRTLKEYRARIARAAPTDHEWGRLSRDEQRAAAKAFRRGKPIPDPEAVAVMVQQYDAVGNPPFMPRLRVVMIVVTVAISVAAGFAGMTGAAIGAAAFFLFFLAVSASWWHRNRQMHHSIEATRRLHALP